MPQGLEVLALLLEGSPRRQGLLLSTALGESPRPSASWAAMELRMVRVDGRITCSPSQCVLGAALRLVPL
ncbi:MAG: hypothetical protein ACNA8W_19265 [Bradymonadaceae bacterium]